MVDSLYLSFSSSNLLRLTMEIFLVKLVHVYAIYIYKMVDDSHISTSSKCLIFLLSILSPSRSLSQLSRQSLYVIWKYVWKQKLRFWKIIVDLFIIFSVLDFLYFPCKSNVYSLHYLYKYRRKLLITHHYSNHS